MLEFRFYKKNLSCGRNLSCFVSLYLSISCLMLVAYNKTNIPCLFCLILKLFTLSNIIFNSASRQQNGMEHVLNIIFIIAGLIKYS